MVPAGDRPLAETVRRPPVAATLLPVAYAAYLYPFGITGLGDDSLTAALVALGLLYLLPLAALGAGVAVGVDRRLRLGVLVAVGGLVLLPFAVPPTLDSLPRIGIAASMLAAGCGVVGAVESALRNRRATVTRFSRAALLCSGVVGVGHATLVLWVVRDQYEAVVDALGLWLAWGAVGMVALGVVPTLLVLRFGLVTPVLGVALLTGNAVRTDVFAAPVDSVTPFYLVVWFVVLPAIVALGGAEYAVRRHFDHLLPRPLVGGDD
ncbi:hypothetical protein C2R22_01740 [Salinigranum rubrum]|uniref:Uncharacterized protein n=1 Tax=Salinigranum rubrum TaxID=755307 RepID=A0A2I8VF33_9EURY|nr:hypothetical protein [Salinigranum rubrum]AUV80537.1 hypothetical protein C2R22_01740 [Salinigranum rubrum]